MIRNETLYIEGIVKDERGNYKRSLTKNEINYLYDLVSKIEPNKRSNKEINPTSGMTALIIKRKNKKIDSLVDFTKKWSKTDLELFNYVGELICNKELERTKNHINYPTWEMVKPPE